MSRQRCSLGEHDIIRSRVEYFLAETTGHQKWAGLLTGECVECGSTLALRCCALCRGACATTDCLPWGRSEDEEVAHFSCAAKAALAKGRVRLTANGGAQ